METYELIAPFVLKTYQMVNDPSTDALITWGRNNNSFVVLDPFHFSRHLLPNYFKHNNFSSFVRQLNTYGFRKVDPDRWEFAHEMFLRGQKHLLKSITRRKSQPPINSVTVREDIVKQEKLVLYSELSRLKQGQRALDEEVEGMNRRLQATEKKPQQMMDFLAKVAEDPHFLSRLLQEKEPSNSKELAEKKRRSSPATDEKHSDLGYVHDDHVAQPEPARMGLIQGQGQGQGQGPPLVDGGLANDGDLYSLVESATASTGSSTSATSIGSVWPMGSISQYSGNNQIEKASFFAEWGGMESNNYQAPYSFRDSY